MKDTLSHYTVIYLYLAVTTVTFLSAVLGLSYLAKCPEVNLAGLSATYPEER